MGNLSQYFDRSEFRCKCGECDFDTVDANLLAVLEVIRTNFDSPVIINSGCRCLAHNSAIDGSKNSQHLFGRAADIVVFGVSADAVADFVEVTWPGKLGLGRYNTFTHIDSRNTKARWDYRT